VGARFPWRRNVQEYVGKLVLATQFPKARENLLAKNIFAMEALRVRPALESFGGKVRALLGRAVNVSMEDLRAPCCPLYSIESS